MLKLYDYWRSSACYRVRIALNLKNIPYTASPVSLKPGEEAHRSAAYRAINPQMRVPAIEWNGRVFTQSMAILEWLDEAWPEPPLLPRNPLDRLEARAFAHTVACDIHPLNNPIVLNTLRGDFGACDRQVMDWYARWIRDGFTALEALAARRPAGDFLFGNGPTLAEICLVPQIYNARRFDVDLDDFPRLLAADEASRAVDAFARAAPEAVRAAE